MHPPGGSAAAHHGPGRAVRAEAIDDPFIADLPELAAQPERRPHENAVVDFVEIPFVEQEGVEQPELLDEGARDRGVLQISEPGEVQPDQHHHQRGVFHPIGHIVQRVDEVLIVENALAPEGRAVDERFGEELPGEDRAEAQHAERNEHRPTALMRMIAARTRTVSG